MKNRKTYKIDNRTKEDICNEIATLAKTYTPEWRFTKNNPDTGSVISMIFAEQFGKNIDRLNQSIFNYHTEFVNMLGVSLMPSNPSNCIVLASLADNTVPGFVISRGTQLYAQNGETNPEENGGVTDETADPGDAIIFETLHDVYVTDAHLTDIFMASGVNGCVKPLLGDFRRPFYLEEGEDGSGDEEETQESGDDKGMQPFSLFEFGGNGIERNALVICHRAIFDVEDNHIYIRFTGSENILKGIADGTFRFLSCSEDGMAPVQQVSVDNDTATLVLEKANKKVNIDGRDYSALVLEAAGSIKENEMIGSISLSSSGEPDEPEFLGDTVHEAEKGRFLPFGDTISLFSDCYIGHDEYLSKAGAVLTVSWRQEYEESTKHITAEQEKEELKPIKRKPREALSDVIAETRADEVIIEYFNGTGWKRLETGEDMKKVFAGKNAGEVSMSFICPEDMEPFTVSGYTGRSIRIGIVRADNCYLLPCVHHYPVIRDVKISYTYMDRFQHPDKCFAVYGTRREDITENLRAGRQFVGFAKSGYTDTALYMGFDRRFAGGPVSLYVELEEKANFDGMKVKYEYSTIKGFKLLKVADRTGMFTSSGTVMFMPPSDMAAITIEGHRRIWIRAVRTGNEDITSFPMIRTMNLNALECSNTETLDEEDFYIDDAEPNMTFDLNAENILSTDVWVNESTSYTNEQMESMLLLSKEEMRAERDFLGNIVAFFVKWKEVNDFYLSEPEDRHYILDREMHRIIFGDGLEVKIPKVTDGVAFRVQVKCCNGAKGNVPPESISQSKTNILFIDSIQNPLASFGGSNIETVESALERGGNILSSRRRLISERDYVREIKAFSGNIDKVRCVTGLLRDGKTDFDAVSIVILMRDFRNGSYSFHKEQENLRRHLFEENELSVTPKDLYIVEPVYVKVSVSVWLTVPSMDDSFDIQSRFEKSISEYLYPVSSNNHSGWEIGDLVRYSQIVMKLNTVKSHAEIERISVLAEYSDQDGQHEEDLKSVRPNPFMICCNGKHHIHISVQR